MLFKRSSLSSWLTLESDEVGAVSGRNHGKAGFLYINFMAAIRKKPRSKAEIVRIAVSLAE
jgi:hypothetical protein